ncbi:MAG TPA: hypothetical protein PLC08_00415 [Candidatus Bipolaricaulis sp.]|mgnify:CR=1 FL=1|nr:hypothetical protein [Candidatus Bipolaricaulis sp.]HRS14194.1 hypothetical protein [Candidatus Bipolaricaulis sp.]HRU21733.1 hypothetical protein [Candidatus Bipolaricaulis sp.]
MGRSMWMALLGTVVCCALPAGAAVNLEQVYCWEENGYCIHYPAEWVATKANDYTLLLSGKAGTDSYYTTVTIASFASTLLGGRYETAQALLNAYKCDLVSGSSMVCIDATGYPTGTGYVAEFSREGETFRQWRVVAARADNRVFHSWAFTAPTDLFPTYLPLAEAMYASWTLDGTSGAVGPGTTATGASITIIFEARDRIRRLATCNSDSDKSLGRCHTITYSLNITAPGYVALSLVFERGQQITATLYDAAGKRVAFRPGNFTDVYASASAVSPGRYTIKVVPELFYAESDFELQVYFSTREFSIDELAALYGPRNRYLNR